jgi:protocatechuate 3,4-dioxygenase beta subunit
MKRLIPTVIFLSVLLGGCTSSPSLTATQVVTNTVQPTAASTATTQPQSQVTATQTISTLQSTPTQPAPTPQSTTTPQSTQVAIACVAPATQTPALTEGPYFKANSPERTSLIEASTQGTKLTLTGYVLTADCKPIAGALLEFWQADAQGVYDNAGYKLRGHQYTDANGRYQLETIIPGLYPGRTEHIHVKIQAPNAPVITTQLFFPDQATNDSDGIFNAKLLLPIQPEGDGQAAAFNFVVPLK